MKKILKGFLVIILGIFVFIGLVGCDNTSTEKEPEKNQENNQEQNQNNPNENNPNQDDPDENQNPTTDAVDYASSVKLDLNSSTKKIEVTVKTYVDGDTTHFNVPTNFLDTGVLKARYLAINTPESTGKIE